MVTITGFDGYTITDMGIVTCTNSGRILKHQVGKNGYVYVTLIEDKKLHRKLIHRLLAIAFMPNPDGLPHINHINGIKTDNKIENLEWCTASQNALHAYKLNLMKPTKGRIKGFEHSEKTKSLMSVKKLGMKHPKFKGLYHTPYGIFESSYEAALAENTSHTYILRRCKSENFKDYFIQ